jgi:hypothetical protein
VGFGAGEVAEVGLAGFGNGDVDVLGRGADRAGQLTDECRPAVAAVVAPGTHRVATRMSRGPQGPLPVEQLPTNVAEITQSQQK